MTVTAVPASVEPAAPWRSEPVGGVPHDSPDSRATVRVYTRETTATGHVIAPPTIVLTLRDNLGLTTRCPIGTPAKRAESCAIRGVQRVCWQATFDMPFNPAQAECLTATAPSRTNDLVYSG